MNNNKQAYYKAIDLSEQKSISSKKLKDIITSTIKWHICTLEEASSIDGVELYHDKAYELLLFGRSNLGLYSDDEYNYIYDKIWKATEKRIRGLQK